jgi:hypothetical protein
VWDAVGEPMLSGADAGPAGLLRAERAIVEFTRREAQLAELRGWYESYGSHRAVHTEPVLQGLHLWPLAGYLATAWPVFRSWPFAALRPPLTGQASLPGSR